MGHVVSKTPEYTVDIDTDSGNILVREDWLYTWQSLLGTKPYTLAEKRAIHRQMDREIWSKWSRQYNLKASGNAPLAKRFEGRTFSLTFDVRWVTHNPNWTVDFKRVPAGTPVQEPWRSEVIYKTHHITLYSHVLQPYTGGNDAGQVRGGIEAPKHEFGHTIWNSDEYKLGSLNLGDTDGIMNIGRQLRARYIFMILATLDTMVPGVRFNL